MFFDSEERLRTQVHLARVAVPREERLRQRRALVGELRLVADERDLALEPGLAQRRRCLEAGLAGSDNDHGRHRAMRPPAGVGLGGLGDRRGEDVQQRVDHGGVELRAAAALELCDRLVARRRAAVRAVLGHRRRRRRPPAGCGSPGRVPHPPARGGSRSVHALVVLLDEPRGRRGPTRAAATRPRAGGRAPGAALRRRAAGLVEDLVGDGDLADVVQLRCGARRRGARPRRPGGARPRRPASRPRCCARTVAGSFSCRSVSRTARSLGGAAGATPRRPPTCGSCPSAWRRRARRPRSRAARRARSRARDARRGRRSRSPERPPWVPATQVRSRSAISKPSSAPTSCSAAQNSCRRSVERRRSARVEAHRLCDAAQRLVADEVAVEVVDLLEVVDVDERQAERLAVGDEGLEALLERLVSEQPGERVAPRLLPAALVEQRLLQRERGDAEEVVHRLARLGALGRRAGHRDPADRDARRPAGRCPATRRRGRRRPRSSACRTRRAARWPASRRARGPR